MLHRSNPWFFCKNVLEYPTQAPLKQAMPDHEIEMHSAHYSMKKKAFTGQIQLHAMLINSFQKTFVAKKVHVSHYGVFLSKKPPIAATTPPHPTLAMTSSKCQIPAGCWHKGEGLGGWEQHDNYPRLDKVSFLCPPLTLNPGSSQHKEQHQGSSLTTRTWLWVSTSSGITCITVHDRSRCCGM